MKTIPAGTIIKIPEGTHIKENVVFLDAYPIGTIGPLCPAGMMELTHSANVIEDVKE